MFRFSRDPALLLTVVASAIRLGVGLFAHLTPEQQGLLDAACSAVAGFLVNAIVRRDGQAAALVGAAQALLALFIGFGLHVSPDLQAAVMSFIGLIGAMFVRTQVTAPVSATGAPQ